METERYRHCRDLRALLNNPMMEEAKIAFQNEIASEILNTSDKDTREALYYENKAFERIMGKLTIFANEAYIVEKQVEKKIKPLEGMLYNANKGKVTSNG